MKTIFLYCLILSAFTAIGQEQSGLAYKNPVWYPSEEETLSWTPKDFRTFKLNSLEIFVYSADLKDSTLIYTLRYSNACNIISGNKNLRKASETIPVIALDSFAFTYNEKDQLIKETELIKQLHKPTIKGLKPGSMLVNQTHYAYDAAGNLIRMENKQLSGHISSGLQEDSWKVEESASEEYGYDAQNRKKERQSYVNNKPGLKVGYTYTPEGWLRTITYYNNDSTMKSRQRYFYREDGKLIKQMNYQTGLSADQPLVMASALEWTYKGEQLLKKTFNSPPITYTDSFDEQGSVIRHCEGVGPQTLCKESYYEYEAGRIILEREGTPPAYSKEVRYRYLPNGLLAEKQVYAGKKLLGRIKYLYH